MQPIPEAVAWAERADAWAAHPKEETGSRELNRWSDSAAVGRPAFPADGVGWRTESAEWRATDQTARWRQTTEWRSSTGTHGWRSTTEAWHTGSAAEGLVPPAEAQPNQLAISGTAWPTQQDDETDGPPTSRTWQNTDGNGTTSWHRYTESPPAGPTGPSADARPAWQQFAEPPAAPWQSSAPAAPWQSSAPAAPWQQSAPSWQSTDRPSATPSWQQLVDPPGQPPDQGRSSWDTSGAAATINGNAVPSGDFGARSAPFDEGRHLVREDDRDRWRRETDDGYRSGGRRRAAEPGSRTSSGTGWSTRSDADNWAGHTDTGSMQMFDPSALSAPSDAPSWRSSDEPAADWRGSTGNWRDEQSRPSWRDDPEAARNSAAPPSWRTDPGAPRHVSAAPAWGTDDPVRRPDDSGPSWRRDDADRRRDEPRANGAAATGWRTADAPTESWRRDDDPGRRPADTPESWRRDDEPGRPANGWRTADAPTESWRRDEPSRDDDRGRPVNGAAAIGWRPADAPGRPTDEPPAPSWRREPDYQRDDTPGSGRRDVGATESWRRDEPPADSWRRDEPPTGSWRRDEPAAPSWRRDEPQPPNGAGLNGTGPNGAGPNGAGPTGWRSDPTIDNRRPDETGTGSRRRDPAPDSWRRDDDRGRPANGAAAIGWRPADERDDPRRDQPVNGAAAIGWRRDDEPAAPTWRRDEPTDGTRRPGDTGTRGWRTDEPTDGTRRPGDTGTRGWRGDEPDDALRRPGDTGTRGWRGAEPDDAPRRPGDTGTRGWRGDEPEDPPRRPGDTGTRGWQDAGGDARRRTEPDNWRRDEPRPAIEGPRAIESGRSTGQTRPAWQDELRDDMARRGEESTQTWRLDNDVTQTWRRDDMDAPRRRDRPPYDRDEDEPRGGGGNGGGGPTGAVDWRGGDRPATDPWNAPGAADTGTRTGRIPNAVGRARPMNPNRRRGDGPETTGTRMSVAPLSPDAWQREPGPRPDGNWPGEARDVDWRDQLRSGSEPFVGDAVTEIRRVEPGWQEAAAQGSAPYREGVSQDWRRDLAQSSDLADGESRRYNTQDFVPFKPVGGNPSVSAAPVSPNVEAMPPPAQREPQPLPQAPPQPQAQPRPAAVDDAWPPRRPGGYDSPSTTGSYERRPVTGGVATAVRPNNLLEPDEDELEEDTGGPLAAVGYTAVWYGVPVVLFLLYYLVVLTGDEKATALDTLAAAAPQFGLSLVLSMGVAVGLRWASGSWKAVSVGLAAAVMGGGLATVLSSAITGNSLS